MGKPISYDGRPSVGKPKAEKTGVVPNRGGSSGKMPGNGGKGGSTGKMPGN